MGVKHLWSIIQPAGKKEPLESLHGKILCVDLSTWICQAEETFGLKQAVAKPYLRNTIFRVLCLKRLGARLIFLTEGKPPELKWNAILARASARAEAEKDGSKIVGSRYKKGRCYQKKNNISKTEGAAGKPKKIGRSVFQRKINECAQLLRYLGIPVIKSEGEAEACCALLDKKKLADGCITQDGDTFLYGANVVYRNLGISSKDPHVNRYSMDDVQKCLGITREEMVALALLFGCDYCDGVAGIGVKTALKLLNELRGTGILQTFRSWAKERKLPDSASSIEKQIFRKVMKIDGFPNEEVIKEFLEARDDFEAIKEQITWDYPDLVNIQRFCFKHMEWPEEYTLSKVLGVATNEHLNRISRGISVNCPFTPKKLVKSRTLNGVPLCEVEWNMGVEQKIPGLWRGYPDTFITLESQQEILRCLPDLVKDFERLKLEKKSKGKKNRKKATERNSEVEEQEDVDATSQNHNSQSNCKKDDDEIRGNAMNDLGINEQDNEMVGFNVAESLKKTNKISKLREEDLPEADDDCVNSSNHYDVDDLVQSFIQIDLSSFCADQITDSMNMKDEGDEKESCFEDGKTSSNAGKCQMLPLRERLQRKVLSDGKEQENKWQVIKTEEGIKALKTPLVRQATQLIIVEDTDKLGTCLSTEVTTSTLSKEVNASEMALAGVKDDFLCKKDDKIIDVKISRCRDDEGRSKDEAKKVVQEKLISPSTFTKLIPTAAGLKEDTIEIFDEEVNNVNSKPDELTEHINLQDLIEPPLDAVNVSNFDESKENSLLLPKETNFVSVSISNDSLACMLSESLSLFDSPCLNEEMGRSVTKQSTPNNDDYINDLRRKLGIKRQCTPVSFGSVNGDSPQSADNEKKIKEVPLALMERLKRRLQNA